MHIWFVILLLRDVVKDFETENRYRFNNPIFLLCAKGDIGAYQIPEALAEDREDCVLLDPDL